jgi:hypothetical protein
MSQSNKFLYVYLFVLSLSCTYTFLYVNCCRLDRIDYFLKSLFFDTMCSFLNLK